MLGLRVTPEIKKRLDAAAEQSGRSQSQEAEFRLERSFDREDILSEVLSAAYGERLAGILMMLGSVMSHVGIGKVIDHTGTLRRVYDWTADGDAFDAAQQAAQKVLDAVHPTRKRLPGRDELDSASFYVAELIKAVCGQPTRLGERLAEEAKPIRGLLGPIAIRMAGEKPAEDVRDLIVAVISASDALQRVPKSLSESEAQTTVASILEKHLKDYIPHNRFWERDDEGQHHASRKEQLARQDRAKGRNSR
jgi:hypothetical protein